MRANGYSACTPGDYPTRGTVLMRGINLKRSHLSYGSRVSQISIIFYEESIVYHEVLNLIEEKKNIRERLFSILSAFLR